MKLHRWFYFLALFMLTALACTTVTNAIRGIRPVASRTPEVNPSATAVFEFTPEAPAEETLEAEPRPTATASADTTDDLKIPDGPTVASPRTTRSQLSSDTPILESLAEERYSTAELSQAGQTYTYTVALEEDIPVLWGTNWCTSSEDILHDNFDHISLEFSVNDIPVDVSQFTVVEGAASDGVCRFYYTLVSDWPEGETILEIRITFEETIDDGFSEYPAGTHIYRYLVTR
jgi:hypothetical protein